MQSSRPQLRPITQVNVVCQTALESLLAARFAGICFLPSTLVDRGVALLVCLLTTFLLLLLLDEADDGEARAYLARARREGQRRVPFAIEERSDVKMTAGSLEVLRQRIGLAALCLVVLWACSNQLKDILLVLVHQVAQVEAGRVLVAVFVLAGIAHVSRQPAETCIAAWRAAFIAQAGPAGELLSLAIRAATADVQILPLLVPDERIHLRRDR